jgi:hypothetical protein
LLEVTGTKAELVELAKFLNDLRSTDADEGLHSAQVFAAAARLQEATKLLGEMRDDLGCMLLGDAPDEKAELEALVRLVRMARYQRRFRGQRDRALRRLINDRVLESE